MIDFLKKITKNEMSTFVGNRGQLDDFEFWRFNVYKEEENDFKTYDVVKTYVKGDEDGREYIEWRVEIDEYSAIAEDFERTLDEECEYPTEEWKRDYDGCFETDEEIIKFLEEHEGLTDEEEWE